MTASRLITCFLGALFLLLAGFHIAASWYGQDEFDQLVERTIASAGQ